MSRVKPMQRFEGTRRMQTMVPIEVSDKLIEMTIEKNISMSQLLADILKQVVKESEAAK